MPKIPTYLASVDYQPPRGDLQAAGAPGRALAGLGGAVADFGERLGHVTDERARQNARADRFRQAHAEAERADGTARAIAALHDAVAAFDGDSDPDGVIDRYRTLADDIGQSLLGAIRDPDARTQAEADYKTAVDLQGTLLRRDALSRLADRGRRDLDGHLAFYAEAAANARHPFEQDEAVDLATREIRAKAAAGFLAPQDASRLEDSFHADIAERRARQAIAADPEHALAALQAEEGFAALAPEARARLAEEARRAVQAQAVRRATEAAAQRRVTRVRLPGYLESLRDGALPDDGRFGREALIATLGEEDGAKRWAEVGQARALGERMAAIRWAGPEEIARSLEAAGEPAEGESDSGQSLLRQAVARRAAQLLARPADYVLANPHVAELHAALTAAAAPPADPAQALQAMAAAAGQGTPAPVAAAAASPEERRAASEAYGNATLAEQERLGVPEDRRQVLPEANARALVLGLIDQDPASADRSLRDLADQWGEAWPQVLDDLTRAGLPGHYALLAGLADPVARRDFARVLAVQAREPGALRAKAGADADAIDALLPEKLAPLLDRVTNVLGVGLEGQALSDDMTRAARLLAYSNAPFTEPREAVRRAIAQIAGKARLKQGNRIATDRVHGHTPETATENSPLEAGDELAGILRDMGIFLPPEQGSDEQGQDVPLLGRMFPPASPGDAADREEATRNTRRRLGRHGRWLPPRPKATPLVTNEGRRIMLMNSHGEMEPGVIPEGQTLRSIVEAGEALAALSSRNSEYSLSALAPLALFSQGMPWDLQRINAPPGIIHDEFRPVSSAAIGAYAAAIGLPFDTLMKIQVHYAKMLSRWKAKPNGKPEEKVSIAYPPLPESNVQNTKIGYDLQIAGKIK